MNAAIFARSGLRARALPRATPLRSHYSNQNGTNIPFSTKNKVVLATGMSTVLGVGFILPFIAGLWQAHKAGRV